MLAVVVDDVVAAGANGRARPFDGHAGVNAFFLFPVKLGTLNDLAVRERIDVDRTD